MSEPWPKEDVPDEDVLFMRAHRSQVQDGDLMPGVFRDQQGGMSTNWKKYCATPEEARQRARKPADNAVISLVARSVRAVPLGVEHTPDVEFSDRSHVDVLGEKTTEVRLKLLEIFSWEIRV